MSRKTPLSSQKRSNKKHKMSASIPPSNEVIDVEALTFTPLSNKGTKKSTAISVEEYAEDRDLHLAIALSLSLPHPPLTPNLIILSDDENDDVTALASKPHNTPLGKRRRSKEKGESSNSAIFVCEICTETKTKKESFGITGCQHCYCTECAVMYVGSKLQENVINIRCPVPGCVGVLEPEGCREILPKEVFDRWGNALCEAVIGDSKVSRHDGIGCGEFQKLNKDEREREDIMLMRLAESKKWRRCPKCKFYVEKSEGCLYVKCRCGHAFCYNCGAPPRDNTHYCYNCRR